MTSTNSPNLYKYQPLKPKKNEIRLLKIHPAPNSVRYVEPVECSLIVTSLDSHPAYKALSYTWGTAPNVEDILLDGRRFKVTPNVEDALLQLRDDHVEFIWIDAICIDQIDLAERSEQVSKMRTIYEQAEEVVVWPGSFIGEAELAFTLLEDLYKHRNSDDDVTAILRDKSRIRSLQSLMNLLRMEYWIRRWVVQEVNSARNITIICGKAKIGWKTFLAVQDMLETQSNELVIMEASFIRPDLFRLEVALKIYGPKAFEMPELEPSSTLPSLFSLLCRFRKHLVSDPRDHIYALAGLSTVRNDPNFIIDYSATTRQVHIDVVKHILSSSNRLDVICATQRRKSDLDLPSWVPDWTTDTERNALPLLSINKFYQQNWFRAAGLSLNAEFSLSNSDEVLTATGFILSRVQSIGEKENLESDWDYPAAISITLSWYQLCQDIDIPAPELITNFCTAVNLDAIDGEEFIYDTTLELMERILAGVAFLAKDHCPTAFVHPDLVAFESKYNISSSWANDRSWILWAKRRTSLIASVIRRRRIFICDQNLIALGPDTVQTGDIVCILLGCSVPVVLRPEDGHYIFLGEACVPGYMYGEAMEDLNNERTSYSLQSFEMH